MLLFIIVIVCDRFESPPVLVGFVLLNL